MNLAYFPRYRRCECDIGLTALSIKRDIMRLHLFATASLALLVTAQGARAELITDGSFENVATLSSGSYAVEATGSGVNGGTVGGWVWSTGVSTNPYNSAVLINVGDAGHPSPWITPATQTGFDGSYVAGVQGLGSVTQSFTDTEASGNFNLSYAIAGRGSETSAGFQTVGVELQDLSTSTVIFTSTITTTGGSNFTTFSKSLNLTLGDNYSVSFTGATGSAGGSNGPDATALVDSVSLSQSVPEPSSLAVLGASLGSLAFLRRRRKA